MTEVQTEVLRALLDFDGLKLLAVVAAVFGSYIAYQQHRTSRARLKLDLFEKRYQVFAGTRQFLTIVLQKGAADLEAIFAFRASIGEASFLFSQATCDYLNEIDRHAINLNATREEMDPLPVGDSRSRLVSELAAERKWLAAQLPELRRVFSPYLGFANWR